jgi:hypothetical protein
MNFQQNSGFAAITNGCAQPGPAKAHLSFTALDQSCLPRLAALFKVVPGGILPGLFAARTRPTEVPGLPGSAASSADSCLKPAGVEQKYQAAGELYVTMLTHKLD